MKLQCYNKLLYFNKIYMIISMHSFARFVHENKYTELDGKLSFCCFKGTVMLGFVYD